MAFKFIPKYDIDFIIAKIYIMGGSFIINDGDTKILSKVIPGYDYFFG